MALDGKPTFVETQGHFKTLSACEASGDQYVAKNAIFKFECQHFP
jgi:hypothetical protein